jgi:protein-tyrosine phosphatase
MRSPFAERLLGTKLRAHGIDGVRVSSAGLSARTGKPADPRAAQAARAYGISLESHRAQLLTPAIVTDADVLVVMDYWNEAQLLSKFPRTSSKIYFLGSCSQSADPIDIGDPYDRDDAFLRNCFERVAQKIDALSRMLSAQR